MSEYDVPADVKPFRFLVAALFAVLLSACVAFGIEPPKTFNEVALATTLTSQGVLKQAIAMRAAGQLSDRDRDNIVATVTVSETGIDIAKGIHATDAPAGLKRLQAVSAGLTALSAYLATKEKK